MSDFLGLEGIFKFFFIKCYVYCSNFIVYDLFQCYFFGVLFEYW